MSYFQPMSIIDLVFYDRPNRDLQQITEAHAAHFFKTGQSDPSKIALGIPAVELFERTVREEEENHPLYHFFRNYLVELDNSDSKLINLFLLFVIHLTSYLGFEPQIEAEDEETPVHFNLHTGSITQTATGTNADHLVLDFLKSTTDNCRDLEFTNEQKREVISLMFEYYKMHVEGFREPESLEVFGEVFN